MPQAAAHRGVELEVITSSRAAQGRRGDVVNFQALAWRSLAPRSDHPLVAPPVVDMLDYLEEHEFTAVHVCTAGGAGLAALLAAKLLHLPITGAVCSGPTFLRDAPRPRTVAQRCSGRYFIWFYSMLDMVFVQSRATARDLVARGLDPRQVTVLRTPVDGDLFSPSRRDDTLRARCGINGEPVLVLRRASRPGDERRPPGAGLPRRDRRRGLGAPADRR